MEITRFGLENYKFYLLTMLSIYISGIIFLIFILCGDFITVALQSSILLTKKSLTPHHSSMQQRREYNHKPFFEEYYYPTELSPLGNDVLLRSIDSFDRDILADVLPGGVVRVIIVIQYLVKGEDYDWHEYRSLTHLVSINRESLTTFKALALHNLAEKSNYYYENTVDHIIFRYRIDHDEGFKPKALLKAKPQLKFTFDNYALPLPNTSNYRQFGTIIREVENIQDGSISYNITIPNKDHRLIVTAYSDRNEIEIIREYEGIQTTTHVQDQLLDASNPQTFKRTSNNREYYFTNGEMIVRTIERKTEFLKPLAQNKKIKTNSIITMDLETRRDSDGVMTVYLLCFYDGERKYSYFIDDYNGSVDDMITQALSDLFKNKYNNRIVYLHNFSSFDGVFLLKYFRRIHNVVPKVLKMENKYIEVSLKVKLNNKSLTIKFRDSLLLLPESLSNLGKTFKVESKGTFPVFFPNNNPLNYRGEVPDIQYFSKITTEEYNKFKGEFNSPWDLKQEAIKYCIQDCVTLYQVLENFNVLIFTNFSVNIWKYPTLPSLALAIYRTDYLKEHQIPITTGKLFNEIRAGFTGGATDMYVPHSDTPVFIYDINSLYP